MTRVNSLGGKTVLAVAHVAGMVDMVALPLWVGNLMQYYGLSPVQAGMTVTLFLFSVVIASAVIAPRFDRLIHRPAVAAGFVVAAAAFFAAAQLQMDSGSFSRLVVVHLIAGLGVGTALSVTHGNIGRADNPHRLFGMVNVALGVFGILFFATLPQLVTVYGAQSMFLVFSGAMALAAIITGLFFPKVEKPAVIETAARPAAPMPKAVWFLIATVICLTFNQAMVFSFMERIGAARGFEPGDINIILVALGVINLLPGGIAAVLQRRLSPIVVGVTGCSLQALLALILSNSDAFLPYAFAASIYVSTVIFTHTFLFGLLARLDGSGRAASATPAMAMIGSATGPAVGGAIVAGFGYGGLGVAAVLVSAMAVGLLAALRLRLTRDTVAVPAE
ncbi:MFS transporter [Rhizobium sp. L1K21]|uniref:MFS transporter n=1 Tax=Rhizobium sp. L1K21 TaxID=2954933 RepID=UPI0020932D37|nr:MFS transporter [Rhizobium sp. L1K21]MCO6188446.1 MFS transporter [Rhizobium sp. L1K21]